MKGQVELSSAQYAEQIGHLDELWQERAACKGPHAGYFFPPTSSERKEEKFRREALAKSVCATCVVAKECLEYALRIQEPHGIWGGLNEVERKLALTKRTRSTS